MSYTDVVFTSAGTSCSGWHFPAAASGPRSLVVMGHGFGGTKDSGLQSFAQRFQAAGMDVLAFDYRGFGTSQGQPRQQISIERQIGDYQAAVAAGRQFADVDPGRIVLWGSSLSGGHVIRVAAGRDDIAAVIAMTPLTSPLAAARTILAQYRGLGALRATANGVRSRLAVARGRSAVMMPVVSEPGGAGALALDGGVHLVAPGGAGHGHITVIGAVGLELATVKTKAAAKALRAPLLVQIADFDRFIPAESVARTAVHGRGQVHHYPCDHFDVWPGHDWFEKACADQLRFLRRVLG